MKEVRRFIGVVNYFRDFIKKLSSHLIPLTQLTKRNATQNILKRLQRCVFRVKDLLVNASQLVIMNETDSLILYTDTSTVSVDGVLMQEQNGVEKPITFIPHILSDQATRWGIMELELYAFVYCVKQLTPYLMGKLFTVMNEMDHKNLVYLANSSIPKLVHWRVLLSEFRFLSIYRAWKTTH